MSNRDSTLRLNLAAAGMLSMLQQLEKQSKELADGMKDIGEESKTSERKVHPMLESTKKGLGAAKSATMELGGQLKSALGTALTLGGALSLGGGIKAGLELNSLYKDVAFHMRTATDEAVKFEDVQKHVEATAGKWKQANEEVARSYDDLFTKTKDIDFAQKASDEVAKFAAAGAARGNMEVLTKLAGDLGDKFGIAADDIGEAMATIQATGRLPEMAENMHEIGAAARAFGMEGTEGLEKYVSMLEVAKSSMKDIPTAIAGFTAIMEPLQNVDQRKEIEKKLKIKLSTDTGELKKNAIEEILGATGGQSEELSKIFSSDSLKIMTEFGKVYSEAFDGVAGTFQEKTEAGMDAFNKALAEAQPDSGKAKRQVEESAADNIDDPLVQLRGAIEKVKTAFAQPKMIKAIEKLAEKLPALADALSGFIDFAVDHPLLVGGGAMALKPAMAFGGSMASDAASSLGGKALDAAKGTKMGQKMAESFSAQALTEGRWKGVGKALGAAAAGLIAYEITKAIVDSRVEGNKEAQDKAVHAGIDATKAGLSGDPEKIAKAKSNLQARIAELRDRRSGVGGMFDQMMHGAARVATGDEDLKSGNMRMLEEAKRDLANLEKAEQAIVQGSEKGAAAQERAAKVWEHTAKRVERALSKGGGEGTNGLPPKPS